MGFNDKEESLVWMAFALVGAFKSQKPEIAGRNADNMLAEYIKRRPSFDEQGDENESED